jgi:hypothetical protein
LDVITLSIFGLKPLYWHIVFLIIRWLSAWGMWVVLAQIWPKHKEQVAWSAIFFTVYPSFLKQSVAVNYKAQFFSYLCFLLSLIFMILAYRKRNYFWQYTILGMFATVCHLFTTEYTAGLELTRPVIIFLIISPYIHSWRERIKIIARNWLPYLLMILVFIGRRFIFFQGDIRHFNSNRTIFEEQGNLIERILDLVLIAFRDVLYVLVTFWSNIFQPEEVIAISPGNILAWTIGIAVSITVYFILRSKFNHRKEKNDSWEGRAVLFGLFSVFVGLIPVWLIGRQVIGGRWADRFSIPALFGASILLVSLLSLLISQPNYRRIVFTVLLGIAISAQIRASNEFRWEWVRQIRSYWQMYWRAPAIEPYTPIIGDGAFTTFSNRKNAAFALNMLYLQDEHVDLPAYWYFELRYNGIYRHIPEMLAGMTLEASARTEDFIGESHDSIIIYTPKRENQCLWFLTPRDVNNKEIIPKIRQLSSIVNLDRILREPISDDYPLEEIFGPEPSHGWCYYFQKASLARQFEDWEEIIRLWDEAKKNSVRTSISYEIIPFIEAFVSLEDWDQAIQLSKNAFKLGGVKNRMLCESWASMREDFKGNDEFDLAYQEATQILKCLRQ